MSLDGEIAILGPHERQGEPPARGFGPPRGEARARRHGRLGVHFVCVLRCPEPVSHGIAESHTTARHRYVASSGGRPGEAAATARDHLGGRLCLRNPQAMMGYGLGTQH